MIHDAFTLTISEHALMTPADRSWLCQLLFEEFDGRPEPGPLGQRAHLHRFTSVPAAVCAVVAGSRTTGLSVDISHWVTSIVPVYEGHALRYAARYLWLGGKHATDKLEVLSAFFLT